MAAFHGDYPVAFDQQRKFPKNRGFASESARWYKTGGIFMCVWRD